MMTFLLVMVYVAFISLGLPDSVLGAAWPIMQVDLNMGLAAAGPVQMVVSAGTVISSLLSGKILNRFGTGRVMLVSVLMTAVALLGFSVAPGYIWLFVFAVPLGLGGGAVDSGLNDFVARHFAARHMNWLHCFWGVGASVGPIILSGALHNGGTWRSGYLIIGCIQMALVAALLFSQPTWKKVQTRDVEEMAAKTGGKKRRPKGVVLGLLSFFFYCGAEASVFLWAASFLVGLRGASAEQAAGWASLYLIGMTVGRLVSGLVADRIGGKNMIRLGQAICVAGIAMMFVPNVYVSVVALFVLGVGCAPIYPMTIHETPRRFGEENSANLVGLQMACAYTGSTLVPPVLGVVCGWMGMIALPVLQVVFLAGQVYCSETLNRRIANK